MNDHYSKLSARDLELKSAMDYIDAIHGIESMRAMGMSGMYGLEQRRIEAHGKLCDLLGLDREKSKDICSHLDKTIGFDLDELESDVYLWLDTYARRLLARLSDL